MGSGSGMGKRTGHRSGRQPNKTVAAQFYAQELFEPQPGTRDVFRLIWNCPPLLVSADEGLLALSRAGLSATRCIPPSSTGLTIGHGDIVLRQALARVAIGIDVSGLFLTGLIAGIAVYAMRTALPDRDTG